MDFSPTQLLEIDAVDVVNLKDIDSDRVSEYMPNATNAPHVQLTGEPAQQIANLWRHLPPGAFARCHIPPFGLRFYRNGELLLQASICWQCDNIFGGAQGDGFSCSFDAQHGTSQKLLVLCKQVFESR